MSLEKARITVYKDTFKSVMTLWENLEFMERKFRLLFHSKKLHYKSRIIKEGEGWTLNMEVYEKQV